MDLNEASDEHERICMEEGLMRWNDQVITELMWAATWRININIHRNVLQNVLLI